MRLAWSRIKDIFEGEWVELTQFEWDWNRAFPTWAVVRHHAPDRNELIATIQRAGEVEGSTILYINATQSMVDHSSFATL